MLSEPFVPSLPSGALEPEAKVVLEEFTDGSVGALETVLVWTLVVVLVGVEELAEIAVVFAGAFVVGESTFATAGNGHR
jgi:hypothetical protein